LFQFKRATVQNSETGQLEPASYRISKVAWLSDEEHPVIGDVVKRIEDLTGLTASTAEELQVLNYGIGGHYEPHCDFAQEKEKDVFTSIGTGNRIATFLFYVSSLVALFYLCVRNFCSGHFFKFHLRCFPFVAKLIVANLT